MHASLTNIPLFYLADTDDEGFDLIQPSLIQQLRTILDQYPDDGQILKVHSPKINPSPDSCGDFKAIHFKVKNDTSVKSTLTSARYFKWPGVSVLKLCLV